MVGGSFSAGIEVLDERAPPIWLSTNHGTMYEGEPTFIPANPKSYTRGVNANEPKAKYIFGLPKTIRNHRGAGYYHIYTREGWDILVHRLMKKASRARQECDNYLCSQCACTTGATALKGDKLHFYERKEQEYKELEALVYFAKAQLEAEGPGATLPQGIIQKYGLDKRERPKNNTNTNYMHGDGLYYYGFYDFGYAAGCGGDGGGT